MEKVDLALKVQEMFASGKIDFSFLDEAFSRASKYFSGTSPGKINRYDNGVKSVSIEGLTDGISPTFGYLPEGDFEFNTGKNQETMHYLLGDLSWCVKGEGLVVPEQYDILVIPAGKELVLNVKSPSLYLCDYLKQLD